MVTATSKLKALDPAATDGTEIARGVIANDVDAALADREDGLLIARHALVARSALVWPAGITAEPESRRDAQLRALGILVRDAA